MKKTLLAILVFTSFISANAQSYLGYYHDNYAGVQGVLFNPASIVDSRFKTDINLFSFSTSFGNDAYAVKFSDAFKSGYDFDTQAKKSFSSTNNAIMNFDIMGPSFMFNITPKQSLAVFTRARAFVNINDINGTAVNNLIKENSASFPNTSLGSPNSVGNSWGELGLSYAAVLYQKGQHFLKGGVTAKYIQGVANAHFKGENISVKYDDNVVPILSTYTTTGTAIYGTSQDFSANSDIKIDSDSKGFGLDLGLVYEWRPDFDTTKKEVSNFKELNKYKLRFGLSVTDLGSINYDKGIRKSYNLNKTITQDDFDNADNIDTFLKDNYPATIINGGVKSKLPTALHADIDWNMHKKFYLNINGDFSMVDSGALNQNTIENRFSVTPRFESRWFSFYVPVSVMQYSGTQIGAGLRTGVFFIGSGSVLSNAFAKESKSMDFHLGMKIPVYQKKLKDTDKDGVYDKDDKCPKVAGPIENKGCPWEDKDGDSVLDKDDSCVDVAGPVENKGCPWADTDGDTVLDKDDSCVDVAGPVENKGCPFVDSDGDKVLDKDDKCPKVAGPVENKGCPWADTDGDTVLDKDDKCPTVKGAVSNAGCPVVDKVVLKKLNDFSKSILFDSGKSTIKQESSANLDEIVKVMTEYGTTNFRLEGYTDNTGVAANNLQLSKDRAAAVKQYLIAKGISSDRLSSEGYGIERPIASNKTLAGRALNRRVEISLIK